MQSLGLEILFVDNLMSFLIDWKLMMALKLILMIYVNLDFKYFK